MPTKAQLQAELEALRHNYDRLESKVVHLEEMRDELQRQLAIVRAQRDESNTSYVQLSREGVAAQIAAISAPRPQAFPRPVFEFDPNLPGDFTRAAALAKANNGVVRRARQEHA